MISKGDDMNEHKVLEISDEEIETAIQNVSDMVELDINFRRFFKVEREKNSKWVMIKCDITTRDIGIIKRILRPIYLYIEIKPEIVKELPRKGHPVRVWISGKHYKSGLIYEGEFYSKMSVRDNEFIYTC